MNPWIELVALQLADVFLLSTLLLGVVLVLWRWMAQPVWRLAVARSTLVALVLLAGLCFLPGWSLVHVMRTQSPANVFLSAADTAAMPPPIENPPRLLVPALPSPNLPQEQTFAKPAQENATSLAEIDGPTVLATTYAVGSLSMLFWLASGGVLARRLLRHTTPATPQLQALLAEVVGNTPHRPRLRVSRHLPTAVALGLRQPTILLPESLLRAPIESLRSVLTHEWAHIRHGDLRLLAWVRGLTILFWPQPLYWLLRRRIRLDQETLADAAAADVAGRHDYVEQLVAWAREATEARTPRLAASVGLWEGPSQLRRRVAVLLNERLTILQSCSFRWRAASGALLALVTMSLSLITLRPANFALAEPPAQEAAVAGGGQRDVKRFSNGATVEVLAIGTHDQQPQRWWDASGRLIEAVPFEWKKAGTVSSPDKLWRRVVIRVDALPDDAEVTWKIDGSRAYAGGNVTVEGAQNPKGYYTRYFSVSDNQADFGLRVGIASGPWRTVVKNTPSSPSGSGRAKKSVVFSPAMETSEGTVVVVSHNYFDQNFRVVAIDKQGKMHDTAGRGGISAGDIYQTRAKFPGLAPKDIDHFEFQVRDYGWVKFENLPLAAASPGTQAPLGNPVP